MSGNDCGGVFDGTIVSNRTGLESWTSGLFALDGWTPSQYSIQCKAPYGFTRKLCGELLEWAAGLKQGSKEELLIRDVNEAKRDRARGYDLG